MTRGDLLPYVSKAPLVITLAATVAAAIDLSFYLVGTYLMVRDLQRARDHARGVRMLRSPSRSWPQAAWRATADMTRLGLIVPSSSLQDGPHALNRKRPLLATRLPEAKEELPPQDYKQGRRASGGRQDAKFWWTRSRLVDHARAERRRAEIEVALGAGT